MSVRVQCANLHSANVYILTDRSFFHQHRVWMQTANILYVTHAHIEGIRFGCFSIWNDITCIYSSKRKRNGFQFSMLFPINSSMFLSFPFPVLPESKSVPLILLMCNSIENDFLFFSFLSKVVVKRTKNN